MRASRRIALILLIFTGQAFAAKGKHGAVEKQPAQSMNSNDPAETEASEKKAAAQKPVTAPPAEQMAAHAGEVAQARTSHPMGVFGNLLFGFGKAPEAGPGTSQATGKTTSVTFMVGGHYDLNPDLTLGLRLPWTVGSATQRDGLNASSQALGAPVLMGEYRVTVNPVLRVPIDFGLGIPLARGDYNPVTDPSAYRQTQLNEMADAASGYRDPELFGPKRFPIILGVGVDYERGALAAHGATKFVLGFKAGGSLHFPTDPAGNYEQKSVTLRNVTSAGIGYQFLDRPKLFGALDSWVAVNAVNAVEYSSNEAASAPSRLQVVFEPRIGAHLGRLSPSLGYIFAIGGRLADTGTSGLELHCDLSF